MVAGTILANLFVQLAFTVGFILLYGGLISLCNRCFYDAGGKRAFGIVRITGYIGTPVHELSHALMCLLFGHTIKKISLFGDNRRSRTLGYVEHSYYPKNLYHQLGNFFIGVSPILAGGGVILLLLRLLVPHVYFEMRSLVSVVGAAFGAERGFAPFVSLLRGVGAMLLSLFDPANLTDPRWWLCLVLSLAVALHMEISRSDILAGFKGLCVILLLLGAVDILLGLMFPAALSAVTEACVSTGVFIALLMLVPALFSAVIGLLSLGVILIKRTADSVENDRRDLVTSHSTARRHRNDAE